MSCFRHAIPFIFTLLSFSSYAIAQGPQDKFCAQMNPPSERSRYFYEGCFGDTVPLDSDIVQSVVTDLRKRGISNLRDVDLKEVATLLRARVVSFGPNGEQDLVLHGEGPPLTGVDNSWFWFVRFEGAHAKVVLWTGGNSTAILAHLTNGYHELERDWCSANECVKTTYRFRGEDYHCVREVWADQNELRAHPHKKRAWKREPCRD